MKFGSVAELFCDTKINNHKQNMDNEPFSKK